MAWDLETEPAFQTAGRQPARRKGGCRVDEHAAIGVGLLCRYPEVGSSACGVGVMADAGCASPRSRALNLA